MLKPAIAPYSQRRCDRVLWFWIDLAVFWLAASAVNHALLVSVYDFSQPWIVLFGTGGSLLLSVLMCYNKYTVIATVLTPFAAIAALLAGMGVSRPLCLWALDFFPWVVNNMPYTDADKTSAYFLPCVLVILFVLTLLFYVLAFQLRAMLGYLAGGAALCILFYFTFYSYHVGHRTDREQLLYSLCVVLCCMLYYLARRQYARTTRRLSFSRSFAPFQRFFLPFFLIAVLVTGGLAPTVLGDTYSKTWVEMVDWLLSQGMPSGFIDSEFMSFYEEQKELGGDIELSDTPLFTVASSAPVHLRSVVYDYYDGRSWTDTLTSKGQAVLETEPMSAHGHGTTTKELYRQYFSLNQPYVQNNYTFGSKGNTGYPLRALTFTIKDSKLYTRTIFSSTYTKRATFLESRNQVMMNDSSALVSSRRMLGQKDSYTVSYLEPVEGTFDYYLKDSRWLTPKEEYLQLPETLPEMVRQLSLMLTQGYSNPYVACTRLSNYLTKNQLYTTTPGDVPEGVDFVDYFLFENNRGYCVYYATAMVVLARASGYPARYVEGFRVDDYDAGRGKVVTGQNAHAWAEIYLDGVGWMTFDPVSSNQFATNMRTALSASSALPPASSSSAPSESEAPVDSSMSSEVSSSQSEASSVAEEPKANVGFVAAILIACLLVAALLCFVITRYVVYRTHWRRRRDSCSSQEVLSTYRELERALRYCRYPRAAQQTVRSYLTSLAVHFAHMDQEMAARDHPIELHDYAALCQSAANAVYAVAYSEHTAQESDRQALLTLTILAERRVKKKLGGLLFALWWKQF